MGSSGSDDVLFVKIQAATARAEWSTALALLDRLDEDAVAAEALELRAQAAYGNGDLDGALTAWSDLHDRLVNDGEPVGAARAAAMAAMFLLIDSGMMAPVRGWIRRAERLLDGQGEVPPLALIPTVLAYERFMSGDIEGAERHARRAIDLGTRLEVPAAVVIARTALARTRILRGAVDEGLAQLEELAIVLASGEVDPLTTGMMMCELVCAAQGLALHDRASEWTALMDHWRHGAAFGGIHGRCRVHKAELLRLSGPCTAAEEEALGACDDLRPWMRREFGWPLAELGNIRLRKGDLEGAEEAFLAAHQHAWSPQPGLALLRLAQGNLDAARSEIADAIEHPIDMPSKERPPMGELRLAPLLDAQSEIAFAASDRSTVDDAARVLREIADRYHSRALGACAALAEARSALLAGNTSSAITDCTTAIVVWADIGAPYEMAMARLVLADAYERAGNADRARTERTAAGSAFRSYGARRMGDVADLLATDPVAATPEATLVTPEHPGTFRRDGDLRHVALGTSSAVVRDLKGFRYVERLLADPGREFHVLDLVAVEQGTLPTRSVAVGPVEIEGLAGGGLEILDAAAKAAYRRRLAEVDDDIDDAAAMNDPARRALAESERAFLLSELATAVGLGGRMRSVGSDSERARTAVTRSIRYSLDQLAQSSPALAAQLKHGVQTGTYCRYVPDPHSPITWTT